MTKLLLDFSKNQMSATKNRFDLFADSLDNQYERLYQRYSNYLPDSLNDFLSPIQLLNKFTFVWPSFDKTPYTFGDSHYTVFNNICCIPNFPQAAYKGLCKKNSICFFCNLQINNEKIHFNKLVVKGITIINNQDCNSSNSITINATPSISLSGSLPQISPTDDNALSPDFIQRLIDDCFPTSKYDILEAIDYLNKWKEYLDFHSNYIDYLGQRFIHLNSAEVIDAYSTDGRHFKIDKENLSNYFIQTSKHSINQVTSSEAVYLEGNVPSRRLFQHAPLIKLIKDFNQKQFESNFSVNKNGEIGKNPDEQTLLNIIRSESRLTKQQIMPNTYAKDYINLGDLVGWHKEIVEPTETIQDIENKAQGQLKYEKAEINKKYQNIIEKELSDACQARKKELEQESEKKIEELKNSFKINEGLSNKNKKEQDYELKKKIESIKKKEADDFNAFQSRRRASLKAKYYDDISRETSARALEITKEKEDQIKKAKEEQNIIRFTIYFIPDKEINDVRTDDLTSKIEDYLFLYHNDSGSRVIQNREEEALSNFESGYVMNPFLPFYLFSPDKSADSDDIKSVDTYYLPSLNDLQKKAVNKALASNGLFLLQGPPGTGKTQVIAEIIAHLVKDGKKVLISSGTHKAIDNVFERLPKIPEIIPVRLIPGTSKKHSEYSFENIVPNFYRNIYTHMDEASEKYKKMKELRDDFEEQMKNLQMTNNRLSNLREKLKALKAQIDEQSGKINDDNIKLSAKKDELRDLKENRSSFSSDYRSLLSGTAIDINNLIPNKFLKLWLSKTKEYDEALADKSIETATLIEKTSKEKILTEIEILGSGSDVTSLHLQKNELRHRMNELIDSPDFDSTKEPFVSLQNELIQVNKKIKESGLGGADLTPLCNKIFKPEFVRSHVKDISETFDRLQEAYQECLSLTESYKDEKIHSLDVVINKKEDEIESLKNEINGFKRSNQALEKDDSYQEYKASYASISNKIQKFFKDFGIDKNYEDISDALETIESKWKEINTDFEKNGAQLKNRLPFYKEVSSYLKNPEVIEQDREKYTAELMKCANVIGLTCTTSKRVNLSGSKNNTYGIEKVDIKQLQIDVVIIDEVSKSSFIDLLIPILYGKSIILVGDHRQLPPIYELARLRDQDFENIDKSIITPEKNKEFTNLVENCFFKTLFSKAKDSRKIMLEQQYRCHSQIMDVFNHFYSGRLKMGFANQDSTKQHYMDISIHGIPVFTPDNHILFIDCKDGLEQRNENSSSIFNPREASVVVELVRQINRYFLEHSEIDKPSLGIISTYGLQTHEIERELAKDKELREHLGIKQDEDEKFIVSSVDDFQGDERDIIILSMVRHPKDYFKSNPGFINAYQRINVALSRARKMLVIVGNRDYLEKRGIIDLPSLDGNPSDDLKNYPIYTKIIEETFRNEGRILTDSDIIDDNEEEA